MNQTFTKNLWSKCSAPIHDYFLKHCLPSKGDVAFGSAAKHSE